VYGKRRLGEDADPLAFNSAQNKLWFDEFYAATVGRLWHLVAIIWEQVNELLLFIRDLLATLTRAVGWFFAQCGDRILIDSLAFDGLCDRLRSLGRSVSAQQDGFLPGYLRLIAIGAVMLGLLVFWIT